MTDTDRNVVTAVFMTTFCRVVVVVAYGFVKYRVISTVVIKIGYKKRSIYCAFDTLLARLT